MIRADRLELDLQEWFDTQAPSGAPDGLLAAVLADVERSQQLPAWVSAIQRARRLPVARPTLLVALLAVLLIGLAAIVAVGSRPKSTSNGVIAFVAAADARGNPLDDGSTSIFIQFPDGRDRHVVFTAGAPLGNLTWSPDGSLLAFVEGAGEASGRLLVLDPVSGAARQVAEPSPIKDSMAVTWAPNGSRLAYSDWGGVYIVAADGSDRRAVAEGSPSAWAWGPAWAPDGQRLSYVRNAAGIWVYDLARAESVQLTTDETFGIPQWSPDGGRIFFNTARGVESMRSDGTGRRLIVADAGLGTLSPDGTALAYQPSAGGIWVADADGRAARELIRNGHFISQPPGIAWSPDSQWVLYLTGRGPRSASTSRIVHPDGTGDQALPLGGDEEFGWAWQPVRP